MRLILGAINGQYLLDIKNAALTKTEEVIAAVAYAHDSDLIFDWCLNNNIPLTFYGRLDADVAVSIPILQKFLNQKSGLFVCKLVQHHHAKIIWWRGYGMYVGSANLTQAAWYKNIEAGCFFSEDEISDEMSSDIQEVFSVLNSNSTPLTEEILILMKQRAIYLGQNSAEEKRFWGDNSLKKWSVLVQVPPKKAHDVRRQKFLEEWYSTLQELRDIGARVSLPENRPSWIAADVPAGAQADQFLHAHYYQRTFDEHRNAQYAVHFERNKSRRDAALTDAINWWKNLETAPDAEDEMLGVTARAVQRSLLSGRFVAS